MLVERFNYFSNLSGIEIKILVCVSEKANNKWNHG